MLVICELFGFSLTKTFKILYWQGWSEKLFCKNGVDRVFLQR